MTPLNRYALPCLLAIGSLAFGIAAPTTASAEGELAQLRIPGVKSKADKSSKGAPAKEVPPPEPNPELRAGLQCIDGLTPGDVQYGTRRDYDVKEGMNVTQRTGFMDRRPATVSNGCFLGEMQPTDCLAMTVNAEKYAALGNSNDWAVQCVYSDDPGAGALQSKDAYPYAMDRIAGMEMVLLCGHSEGDAYECAEGSNSARSGVWSEKMKAQGKEQLGFCNYEYTKQSLPYDTAAYPSGRWIYCQYYNAQSKKNLFGFEFLQTSR